MGRIFSAFVVPALAAGLRMDSTQPEDHSHPVASVDDDDEGVGLDLLTHMGKSKRNFPATWFNETSCEIFTSVEACEKRRSNLTYLASFPGSGNTWTRVLLQAATGIYTGSIYNDSYLRKSGLLGESHVEAREVIAVKTHQQCWAAGSHGSALVVVRHPLHAVLAEASRNCSGGSHSAEVSYEELRKFFTKNRAIMMTGWSKHVKSWMECPAGKNLIVRFEDIVKDTYGVYVRDILPFFDIDTSNKALLRRLRFAIDYSNSNRATRRSHSYKFQFTDEDRSDAQRVAGDVMEKNGYGPIYTA